MNQFWDGFEKKAVTAKWIDTRMFRGLASRAGEKPSGQLMKRVEEISSDQPAQHWRKLFKGDTKEILGNIKKMNLETKKSPEAASRSLLQELMGLAGSTR